MEHLFVDIGRRFGEETQVFWTQVLALLWSGADLLLIFTLLRIAGAARAAAGLPGIRWRYRLLLLTALLTPALAFARDLDGIFLLETLITGPQYLILIGSLVIERKTVIALAAERIRQARAVAESGRS